MNNIPSFGLKFYNKLMHDNTNLADTGGSTSYENHFPIKIFRENGIEDRLPKLEEHKWGQEEAKTKKGEERCSKIEEVVYQFHLRSKRINDI